MRRIVLILITVVAIVAALGAAAVATNGGQSTVTQARLERSLPTVFANLYVQQTRILGRNDVTAASLHPRAMCDKHGPDVADVGPGGDWICLMSWDDPEVPMPPEGYGKFELNVHSNDCYTAAGPTKLTGFLTITDTEGRDVTNPVFEFDGCFDPQTSNSPTDVVFPSLLGVTSTSLTPDSKGQIGLQVTCGTGSEGCTGSVTATTGNVELGTVPMRLKEESSGTVTLPTAVPAGTPAATFTFTMSRGAGPTSPVTIPVQGRS